ncbi:MAG: hypothetical protein O3A53_01500 [Acidobacteria bacterium]|nr:hypothetical protein [Acidobacteriota bacterium]
MNEELEGFSALAERVKEVFPTSKQQWELSIWTPAFTTKYTVIYSKTPGVLLVAADSREVRAMAGMTKLDLDLRRPGLMSLGVPPSLVALHGPGVENARVAVNRGFERIPVGALVSVGYVGALDPTLDVGQIFVARQIAREGSPPKHVETPEFPRDIGVAQGTLLTIDRVAQTCEDKRTLRRSGADAVDMEAYAVAEEAERRSVPFYCVRVVSDRADTDFPVDFNRARRSDGTFAGWRVLAQAGLNPSHWKRLLSLKRDSELASQRLADFLSICRFDVRPG